MSDRMTSITLPGAGMGNGLADWGRLTPEEMIKQLREKAGRDLKVAQEILMAKDGDFCVETYLGPHARREAGSAAKGT